MVFGVQVIMRLLQAAAVITFAFASFGNRQYRGKGSFYFGRPGISFFIRHKSGILKIILPKYIPEFRENTKGKI